MKYIEVNSCEECPYRAKTFCLKSAKEITFGKFYEKYNFPKDCELQSKPAKKNSEVNEYELKVVEDAYTLYRQKLPNLPALTLTSASVKKYFKAIMKCKDVNKVFTMVAQSDFLQGKSSNWKADFDWIFKPAAKNYEWNVDKILSGKYSKVQNVKSPVFTDKQRTYGEWK